MSKFDPLLGRPRSVDKKTVERIVQRVAGGAGGGANSLNDLTDVTISSPSSDQTLVYDGSGWVNDTSPGTTSAGTLAARPAASADNSGQLYLATDTNGGTLYRSNGTSWVQVAADVNSGNAWTPDYLSGLRLFLLADDIAQADASAVASWVDRKNAYNFEQATGSKQPVLYTTTAARLINGQPVVTSGGTDDLLVATVAQAINDSSGSIFAVWRPTTGPSVNSHLFASASDDATNAWFGVGIHYGLTPDQYSIAQQSGGTQDRASGGVFRDSMPVLTEWKSTGTTWDVAVNGRRYDAVFDVTANSGDWLADVTSRDNLTIFGRKGSAEAAQIPGDLAALIIVSSISDAERGLLYAWVQGKYGFDFNNRVVDEGTSVLVGGTVTVTTPVVTANSKIYLTSQVDGGTVGFLRVSARTANTSFVITSSSGSDTSTVAWQIVEP